MNSTYIYIPCATSNGGFNNIFLESIILNLKGSRNQLFSTYFSWKEGIIVLIQKIYIEITLKYFVQKTYYHYY